MFNFKEIMKAKLVKENDYHYYLTIDGKIIADTEAHPLSSINVSKLSKQNCDEIFGVVDVEKLADELKVGISYKEYDHLIKRGIIVGFNKAMELNKDKLFTLEDMMNCWNKALKFQEHKETLGEFIQSLQQPTEIDVVIVMECPQCQEWGYVSECRKDCNKKFLQPKLDSERQLIIKKI